MKKNWTCSGALELTLASFYIRQFMRLIVHFYSELTLNHHWVFVITSFCDRTITVQASWFGAWCLTTNTGNSPPIQKGAPAATQHCLITSSRRTVNASGDTEVGALMFGSLYFILIKYQLAVKLAMLELMCVRACVRACVCVCETRSLQLFPYTSRINFKHLLSY